MAETGSSVLVFGRRTGEPVVLKVVKHPGDEWLSGAVLSAFRGKGVVRVFDYADGALLLERLSPGESLAGLALSGDDTGATEILADVIGRMSPAETVDGFPSVEDWGRGFERYKASAATGIPGQLLDEARDVYFELCRSQSHVRLLHGDLHQGNVLLDSERGWLAIDPKGVIGEPEYEVGAALRNPLERPDLFLQRLAIRRRVDLFSARLDLDPGRMLAWSFAQAVLSAIWALEDGLALDSHPWLAFAAVVRDLRPFL